MTPEMKHSIRVECNGVAVRLHEGDPPFLLGREATCGIVLNSRRVGPHHLRVVWEDAGWHVEDAENSTGTFLNGHPVRRMRVVALTEVRLGDPTDGPIARFEPGITNAADTRSAPTPVGPTNGSQTTPPPAYSPPGPDHQKPLGSRHGSPRNNLDGDIAFGVYDLTVESAGVRRLDRVSFVLHRGEMLGLLGGSGAGKSTLLKAITGSEPSSSGLVLFEGRDLYRDFRHIRDRIGYVPQDDILHASLTVRATLNFGSMLRLPNATDIERDDRVQEVASELGLVDRLDAKINQLSGGQRKRVNVGLELLARPPLLILDEPTSGLDPANERSLMQLLRRLADDGRVVIVVTHSTDSLHVCDQVLFLARGGSPAYLGSPLALAAAFRVSTMVDAFGFVDSHPNPMELRARFDTQHESIRSPTPTPSPDTASRPPWRRHIALESERVGRDFWILLRRAIAIAGGDRRNLVFLCAQGPVIALLMLIVFGSNKLQPSSDAPSEATSVLLALVLSVIFIGASSSVREIVKERPIFLREQAVGVSTAAYLASKWVMMSTLVVFHAMVILGFALLRQGGPHDGFSMLGWASEVALGVILAGLGAVALGLLISALVTSADKAMTMLPIALFVQLLLAGVIVPIGTLGIQQLSWLVGARWGLDAAGSTVDLWSLRGCSATNAPGLATPACSALWTHEVGNLLIALVMLTALCLGALLATFRTLQAHDPVSVLASRGPA